MKFGGLVSWELGLRRSGLGDWGDQELGIRNRELLRLVNSFLLIPDSLYTNY